MRLQRIWSPLCPMRVLFPRYDYEIPDLRLVVYVVEVGCWLVVGGGEDR